MKFFRLDLLTLLISLFILNGCKRQDGIGLGVNDQNEISGNLIVDTNVIVNTVAEDTAATSGLSKTPLANFVDPVFGTTQSFVAIGVNLPNNAAYTVPAGTLSIDSAVLVLRYADGFYGDSLASRYKISAYQLQNKVESKTYYSNNHWDPDLGQLLGTKNFTARTHDSITIARIRTDTVDTIQRVPPQLRVPISKAFIYNHLFNAPGNELSSVTAFQNSFKGVYLKLDRAQASDAGGVIQLNLTSSSIDIFYKVVNNSTTDTASVSLPFFNRAAEVKHNYEGTPVETQLKASLTNPGVSQNTIYMQGLAGLRAKVSFPGLEKLADSAIVLNRAEIVITPKAGSGVPYAPLPKLTMYKLDLAKQRALIQDANGNDPRSQTSLFGGRYDRTKKEYHFLVTAYVQDLISKKTVDYGTFIAPVDTTLINTTTGIDVGPTVLTAARSVLVGSDKTSPYSIRLNIIYTRIRK
ncbi:DUF4270 family protein [Mucilaginibacter celer]|uniref:DUF4270 family protein n=1 Tax=Mucilaginibacter celer TaxID=2305508 RepID=A0A494W337_9SPHI|nr:DUF4270 family protein [Mucilaginibacter celer]AYL97722.1 DUF4270 family protein [Mucilaginibacter celer]